MKKITGLEVLDITDTFLTRPYGTETEGFKGKNYKLYALGEKAFAVHEDSSFHNDYLKGDIHSVNIDVTDKGWSLMNHVTFTRVKAFTQHTVEIESITIENFKPQRMVNPAEYTGL
jgi:hypothetical protein